MKLADLESYNTTDIKIKFPSGGDTGVTVTTYVPDSLEWDKIENKLSRHLSGKTAVLIDKDSGDTKIFVDPRETKANHEKLVHKISSMVVSISGADEFSNGVTVEGVKSQLFVKYPWVFEQVDKHLGKRQNWFTLKN